MHKAFPLPGESSHWQYKFPLPVEGVPTARRLEIPLAGVYTAMMKKLPVKDRWQIVPFFDTMLVQQGEGSGTPTEPHHTPSLESSALPTVADEPASPVRDDSQGEACPTDSGFIADQDRATIAKDKSRDNAPIKGRSNNEGEAPAERISNDSEEIARVLTSIDAATVLAGEANVPTGSGFIPTAGPPATIVSTGSEVGPTASPIVQKIKGKEIMVESDTPKNKKIQEQIDAQVARELEEQQEREDMRMNEQIARDAEVIGEEDRANQ
nr:hypothetical protein [Tanacetum cinerariifolium]